MKHWKLRLTALVLATALATASALPALAAGQTAETATTATSLMDTLLDVPVLGQILRFFTGNNDDATIEIATAETAATPETAETATPEAAPTPTPAPSAVPDADVAATPAPTATAAPTVAWPAAWMTGAAQAGQSYPLGAADATACTAAETLWGDVTMYNGAVLRAASREETNLGDLAADALAMAAAAESRYTTDPALNTLPLVAVVDGGSLSGTVEAGTLLDDTALATVLADERAALVTITPQKLKEVLNAALVGMMDASSSNFGSFLQVSGLRFTYMTANGAQQVSAIWLADAASAEGKTLDLNDSTTKIALVLPAKLLDTYGLNAAAGYTDWLSGAALTLRSALLSLGKNADAATLSAVLARGGSVGRILPVTATSFDAMLIGDYNYANMRMSGLLDGKAIEFVTDANGSLILTGLAPGSHTFRMKAGEPAYYISSITHIGTADGSVVQVTSIPADCVLGALPTPAPTAAPTAEPTAAPTVSENVSNDSADTSSDAATPTPAPAAAAPAATATPKKTNTGSGTATIKDPTAGTILNTTPVPTIAPTPTPTPVVTPAPTTDPEALAKLEEAEKKSSHLPLYIGLGVLVVCVGVGGGLLIKRRLDDGKTDKYRKK